MPSATLTLGSFLVAIMVGLTGMGGGALLTPMLTLVFGVPPVAAVSSDLVVSAITKPVAALVHVRRGTVDFRLAGWLSAGSVPGAFLGGLLGWWLGPGGTAQMATTRATGVVLVAAAALVTARRALPPALRLRCRRPAGRSRGPLPDLSPAGPRVSAAHRIASRRTAAHVSAPRLSAPRLSAANGSTSRIFPTVLIGIVAGLAVGVTSTGSGTLVIAALAALHPALPTRRLVGTDLAQAVPMVLAGTLAHLAAGDIRLSVTAPLIAGGIPGVVVGSRLAARAPGGLLRPVLGVLVLASGLSMLGVGSRALAGSVAAVTAVLLTVAARQRLAGRRPRAAAGMPPGGAATGGAGQAGAAQAGAAQAGADRAGADRAGASQPGTGQAGPPGRAARRGARLAVVLRLGTVVEPLPEGPQPAGERAGHPVPLP